MRKYLILFSVVITAGLLFAFAALPEYVFSVLDIQSVNTPFFHNMPSLQLHLNAVQPALTALEKLALLCRGKTVNITQDQATMTEAAVQEAVYSCMTEYEKAGIVQWFEPTQMSMQPHLMYDPADSARHLVVWTVTMIGGGQDPEQVLLMDIDDETGTILCISYDVYGAFSMEGVWERNQVVMEKFTDIYFSQLGLLHDGDASNTENAAFSQSGYKEIDGGSTEVIYTFEDDTNGIYHIQFTVDGPGGFGTYFYQ